MKKYKPYIITFAAAFLTALLGGIVTYVNMGRYEDLIKPPLSPPGYLFPIVWTILYALMAYGAGRIYSITGTIRTPAIYLYGVQLLFNFGWSLLYFGFGAYLAAFIWLLILWAMVAAMIVLFYRTDRKAGLLQIPYLLWLSFAAYLNLAIYLINFT